MFSMFRCEDSEFEAVAKRVIHQAYRNGANTVLVEDREKGRFAEGQRYGFYVLRQPEEKREAAAGVLLEACYQPEEQMP